MHTLLNLVIFLVSFPYTDLAGKFVKFFLKYFPFFIFHLNCTQFMNSNIKFDNVFFLKKHLWQFNFNLSHHWEDGLVGKWSFQGKKNTMNDTWILFMILRKNPWEFWGIKLSCRRALLGKISLLSLNNFYQLSIFVINDGVNKKDSKR